MCLDRFLLLAPKLLCFLRFYVPILRDRYTNVVFYRDRNRPHSRQAPRDRQKHCDRIDAHRQNYLHLQKLLHNHHPTIV